MPDLLLRKKKTPRKRVHILLKCKDCKSVSTYEADLFRQAHLKSYRRNGYITQACACDWGGPHIIKGLYTETVSKVDQAHTILRDLESKKWG